MRAGQGGKEDRPGDHDPAGGDGLGDEGAERFDPRGGAGDDEAVQREALLSRGHDDRTAACRRDG